MADNFNIKRETPRERDIEKSGESERQSKEVSDKRREMIEGVSEVVEGPEVAEFSEGEVSERTGEGKKKAPSGSIGTSGGTVSSQNQIFPDLDVMVIQISTKIKKELAALEKERKKVMNNPAKFSPFRLNEIIMRIRELKDILADLATQTAGNIKQLWQRFVRGTK